MLILPNSPVILFGASAFCHQTAILTIHKMFCCLQWDVSIISIFGPFMCACVCPHSRIDRPTVVKFTGHLGQCSLLLMVLFRKLRQRGRETERGRKRERESEDDNSSINHFVNEHPSPLQYWGTDVWLSVCVRMAAFSC